MAGPMLAFEPPAELRDLDPGLKSAGVELLPRGDEEDVHTRFFSQPRVALLVARVGRDVLVRGKLGRIDEEACNDPVVVLPRRAEERQVPLVEGPHRRDQADLSSVGLRAEVRDRADDLHAWVASASTS